MMRKLLLLFAACCLLMSATPKKDLTWVAIGDSITYLDNNPAEAGNRITEGYMARVARQLPYIHYTNQGHNGWKSTQIAHQIETLGLIKADIYSVFLTTNDWWGSIPPGKFADYQNNTGDTTVYGAYRIIINKLRSLNPDAHIILMTPLQRGDFVYVNNAKNNAFGSYKNKNGHSLAEFADAVKVIAKAENLKLVDLYNKSGITPANVVKFKRLKDPLSGEYKNYTYPDYVNIPFNPATDEYPYPLEAIDMTYDGLHPSDKGYKVIADMLIKVMKKF